MDAVTGIVDVIKKAFSWGLEKAESEGLLNQSEGINYDEIVAQLNIAKSGVERIKLKMSLPPGIRRSQALRRRHQQPQDT